MPGGYSSTEATLFISTTLLPTAGVSDDTIVYMRNDIHIQREKQVVRCSPEFLSPSSCQSIVRCDKLVLPHSSPVIHYRLVQLSFFPSIKLGRGINA